MAHRGLRDSHILDVADAGLTAGLGGDPGEQAQTDGVRQGLEHGGDLLRVGGGELLLPQWLAAGQ